jgi:putative phosphoribosyl transferase
MAVKARRTAGQSEGVRVADKRVVRVPLGEVSLDGDLQVPIEASGVVLFAHGSGSGRHSPRNQFVADRLASAGFATLLIDLLTEDEEWEDRRTAHLRFDIPLLATRLVGATDWLTQEPLTKSLQVGFFGASTGAAAALLAATKCPDRVGAVISRGGRPDLVGDALPLVQAPTLLIVGGHDSVVLALNDRALNQLKIRQKRMDIIPGATHLFEEPGTLEQVASRASDWFKEYLAERPRENSGQNVKMPSPR